jgi:hypothetical protein
VINRLWTAHKPLAIAIPAITIVALLVGSLLLVNAAGGTAHASPTPAATETASPSPSPSPTPTPYVSPTPTVNTGPTPLPAGMAYADLDGVLTSSSLAHRLPMAIMVDDNRVARPQSGISSASIVYQAYADGGEDRYMMIFQEGTATDIGPVRSVRPYYIYWAAEYKAMLGHYGGDMQSLRQVIPANANYIYNMDALHLGSCPYHRTNLRAAPHNAYTNSGALIACLTKKALPTTYQKLPTRPFVDNTPTDQLPAAQTISIGYNTGTVGYQFNPATDSYLRIIGGAPEIDPANKHQVFASSIVVMYQLVTEDPSVEGGKHARRPNVHNVGSGKATIFQEGKQIAATWKKKSNTALTRFYDASGNEIPLVRGEIFIQSIKTTDKVTVK